jgi:hypothetical protein
MDKRKSKRRQKVGLFVFVSLLTLTGECCVQAAVGENTKIYTVFVNQGCSCPAGGTPEGLTTNDEIIGKLQRRCSAVHFIARDLTKPNTNMLAVLNELEASKAGLDGVLIFGALGNREYKFAFTGLPTICVYSLFEWMNVPYKLYRTGKETSIKMGGSEYKGGRIITAQLDRRNVCSPSASAAMFEDLVGKIKIIQAIKRLRESRILVITPLEYLNQVDYQGDRNRRFPKDYNQTYTRALKESLGVELVRIAPQEFYEALKKVDIRQAQQIAKRWIEEAQGMKDTTESEVVKTARSYLAFEALRNHYNCNAVSTHMRSLTGSGKVEDMFWPGLGLMEFQKRGIQAICQEYENIMVAHLLGYYLTGRPSMLGDLMIDTFNNTTILTHCGAPVNPYGDDRRIPYIIWSHAQSPVRGTLKPGSGTGAQVNYPVGEPVTIWKVYVLHKKIGLYTGCTADGHSLYRDFDGIMCRTKLVVKVDDARKIQQHFSPDEYGIHRAGTLGDLRQIIRNLGILMGFEVVEEDE